ncbi:MAG: ABC transporter ATP-binding protein [Infirmifilum sp.]
MAVEIKALGLSVFYDSYEALSNVSVAVSGGEVLSIAGPNGAGKTTLLKTLARILKPKYGAVYIDGKEIYKLSPREVARSIGYVPQRVYLGGMLTVYEFVMTGRRPHFELTPSRRDEEKVLEALSAVGALGLAERPLEQLSGGELQRVMIARALAGEPKILLLDEPTSSLDLKYQVEVQGIIDRLKKKGLAVILTSHDLTFTYRVSDSVVLLKDGRVYAAGKPEQVLTPENIYRVYGVEVILLKEHRVIVPSNNTNSF